MRKQSTKIEREFSREQTAAAFAPLLELRSATTATLGTEQLIYGQIACEIQSAAVVCLLSAPDVPEGCLAIRGVLYTTEGADNLGAMIILFNLNLGDKNVGRGFHYKSKQGGSKYFCWLFPTDFPPVD